MNHNAHRAPQDHELEGVVQELCNGDAALIRQVDRVHCGEPLPSRDEVLHIVTLLRQVLFPGYFGSAEVRPETLAYHIGSRLDEAQRLLRRQIRRGLAFACTKNECASECYAEANLITQTFLKRLPRIQRLVASDVRAAYEGDPAARSPDEAIFSYPGVLAVASYRMAHELYEFNVPLLPRMITEHAHSVTGIDIHPGAQIGERFFIDHGTGVVIGETCIIGNRVRLYQGVTLGAKSFPLDAEGHPVKGIARHPVLEDDVIVYAGATILGRVTIGRGSVIGGNVWLTQGVPPGSRVSTHSAAREPLSSTGAEQPQPTEPDTRA